MPISWDIDMANLAGKDINVCEKPKRKLEGQLAITTHNIVCGAQCHAICQMFIPV